MCLLFSPSPLIYLSTFAFPAIVSLNNKITKLYLNSVINMTLYQKYQGILPTILSKINLYFLSLSSPPSLLPLSFDTIAPITRCTHQRFSLRAACGMQQVSALTSGWSEWEREREGKRETWCPADKDAVIGSETRQRRKYESRKKEKESGRSGDARRIARTYETRPAHDSSVGIRRLFPPRGLSALPSSLVAALLADELRA